MLGAVEGHGATTMGAPDPDQDSRESSEPTEGATSIMEAKEPAPSSSEASLVSPINIPDDPTAPAPMPLADFKADVLAKSATPKEAQPAVNTRPSHTPRVAIDLRSVLCMNLPWNLRHPYALRRYFEHTLRLGDGEVEAVSVVGLHSELLKSLSERFLAITDVEKAWVAWRGNDGERNYAREGEERVAEVGRVLEKMRKELESDRLAGVGTLEGGIEMQELPALPPRPVKRPGWWTKLKSKLVSVAPSELQSFDALSEAWARFRFHNRRVHILRKEAAEGAQQAFDGKRDGPAGAFAASNSEATIPSPNLSKTEKIAELYTGSTAFITFKNPRSAAIASQMVLPPGPGDGHATFLVLPSPPPGDLYWPNLSSRTSTPKLSFIRTWFSVGSLVALVFFWSIPVGMIASMLSVENLTETFPGFENVVVALPPYVLVSSLTWVSQELDSKSLLFQGRIPRFRSNHPRRSLVGVSTRRRRLPLFHPRNRDLQLDRLFDLFEALFLLCLESCARVSHSGLGIQRVSDRAE